jgi:hypothetical protein
VTTDHDEIREWVEERGGSPACVRGTGGRNDTGMLRIDFPGWSGEKSLQHIDWEEWFEAFDENNLAFLHQDTTHGGERSNFNKLISREGGESNRGRHGRSGTSGSKSRGSNRGSGGGSRGKGTSRKGTTSRAGKSSSSSSRSGASSKRGSSKSGARASGSSRGRR